MITRRTAALSGALAALLPKTGYAQTSSDRSISLDAAGLSKDIPARFEAALRDGELPNMHGVIVMRAGRIAFERYLEGQDEVWGRPTDVIQFSPETLHDLRSVTKSIVALLYGIALAEGKVPSPSARLHESFPEYRDLAADPKRARLTIAHVLTMTLGADWNENLPYTNPANSELAMERAADRYRFILERPIVAEPGARWIYSGGATALIARIIAKGVGQPIDEFARAKLFEPLGIGAFEWARGADDEPSAASGLRLRPRDLARIGQLIIDRGTQDGRVIAPAAWIDAALKPAIEIGGGVSFGYHWYVGQIEIPAPGSANEQIVLANGNGGQRLFILPRLQLLLATVAGNYNQPRQDQPARILLRKVVLPGMKALG